MNYTLWTPIPRFPGYEASLFGMIRNWRGKILSQRKDRNGAMRVDIGKATVSVHKLVLPAWTGHPLEGEYYPKHLNNDKSDNRLENLVWAQKYAV